MNVAIESAQKVDWFENLTKKKRKDFLMFIETIQESYMVSDAIVKHNKEKRSHIADIFTNMKIAIKYPDKVNSDRHPLLYVFDMMDGKAAFVLFLRDMKKYFDDAIIYKDWDDEAKQTKKVIEIFEILFSSLRNKHGLFY